MKWKRKHFQTIDSTNNWAKAHMKSFSPSELTVISADYQTAGRGRFKRSWVAPSDANVLMTFCFFLSSLNDSIGNIPQVLALSVCKVLSFLPIRLKWPNDLLLERKKMGGILCETVQVEGGVGVALGIGINVNMTQQELALIDIPAHSLLHYTGKRWDRERLIEDLANQFASDLETFKCEGIAAFLAIYRSSLDMPAFVTIQDGHRLVQGAFHSIDERGGLVIQLQDGILKTVYTGEIVASGESGHVVEL